MKPAPPVTRYEDIVQSRKSNVESAAAGRKPNSVPLRETIIPLVPALLTGSSDLPGSFGRAVLSSAFARLRLAAPARLRRDIAPLFGLAPCGVLPAICLTADAVRSYRTFSPLPSFARQNLASDVGASSPACPDEAR